MTVIQRGPPAIDFAELTAGVGELLEWWLGTEDSAGEFVPDDLTGCTAELVLWPGSVGQARVPLTVDGPAGHLSVGLPASVKASTPYLVLVEEQPGGRSAPRVRGTLDVGMQVTP